MKKYIFSIFLCLYFTISYSQFGVGIGYEVSGNSDYNSALKVNLENLSFNNNNKGFIIGLDLGMNFIQGNMTGYIGLNEYPEDATGEYLNTVFTPALKLGFQLTRSLYITGSGGMNILKEYKDFNAKGSIGKYTVATGNKNNSPYYRIGLSSVKGSLSPNIGFGSNGFYAGATFYFGNASNKIKQVYNTKVSQAEAKKKLKELKNSKIEIAGYKISNLNIYDLESLVRVFLEDCKDHGVEVKSLISATFNNLNDNTIALAFGGNNDREIVIKVDPILWKDSSIQKKMYILYHELGHDVLNLEHGQGGKMMFNFADREYSWDEFFKDKEYMFSYYLDNKLNEKSLKRTPKTNI